MENKIVKLGVVGLGRGFSVFCGALGNKNVKMHAICDKKPELVEKAKARLDKENIKDYLVFDEFEDLIKSDIDAVIIATEAIRHVPFAIKAMEAGKHVLSEIPTVNSLEEAQMLKACVKAHPELKYMAGENCCYWAFIQAWKKMYEDGKFGDVVYAEAEYLHAKDYRDYEPYPDGHWRSFNPAVHYITHSLGPLLYITGDKVKTVTCFESDIVYNPYKKGSQNGAVLIKTEKGAIYRIFIGFGTYVGFDHNFRINGTRGSIQTDPIKGFGSHSFASLSDIPGTLEAKMEIPVGTAFAGESTAGHGGADGKMLNDFINCIINDTEPTLNVDMGIEMTLPGLLAHQSSEQGGIPLEMPKI